MKPATEEMRKVYQNVRFVNFDPIKATVDVYNDFAFTNLNKYDFTYTIKGNGEKIYEGLFSVDVEPYQTKTVMLKNLPHLLLLPLIIRLYLRRKIETPYHLFRLDM